MTKLTLRRATAEDAEAVRTLTRLAYAPWAALIGREPRPMVADYDHAVRAHIIDLHEAGGEIDALIEMIPHADHLLIENIAVDPRRQGQGFGDALLAHAEATASAMGHTELRLYTNAAFATNLAFYARRGFTESGREPIPAGGQVVHMSKKLPG